MNALQRFAAAISLPDTFGQERPYVRYAYLNPGELAGADADVEFRETDGGNQVVVTVSEWQSQQAGRARTPLVSATFDAATGEVLGGDETVLETLLGAVMGMRLLGEEASE